MAITLAQLAQVETDPMKKFIQLNILRECRIMEILPFENVDSLQVSAQWWETLPTGGYLRSLNEGCSSSEDGQLGEGVEALFGFGTDITFDSLLEKIKNVVRDPVQVQGEGKLKSMSIDYNYTFIKRRTRRSEPKHVRGPQETGCRAAVPPDGVLTSSHITPRLTQPAARPTAALHSTCWKRPNATPTPPRSMRSSAMRILLLA
jgi:hypothetical protein